MKDFNVKVTSWIENREAQELFFKLGASWCYGKHINENIPNDCDIILHNFGSQLFWANTGETENYSESKEITIQELRDMVKPKVKEYLTKNSSGNYQLVNHRFSEDDIKIPKGANYAATNGHGIFFSDKDDFIPDLVVWVRESLNDRIASAEVARQEEKHSHYKKDVSHLNVIDPYRIADLYDLHPCAEHIMKKSLCAGGRGHKDMLRDIQDIIDTAERWKQMIEEDNNEI